MKRPAPVNEEVFFDGRTLISETDTKGIITFVNRKFVEMSGYAKEEALGQPHSLLRHPDMPKAAFEEMWRILQTGKMWEGYVKNLRKDGKFYWVIVNIIPKYDEDSNIIGYTASRKIPNRDMINKIALQYKDMLEKEK